MNDDVRFGLVKPAALQVYGVHTTQTLQLPATTSCCMEAACHRAQADQLSKKLKTSNSSYSVKIDQNFNKLRGRRHPLKID